MEATTSCSCAGPFSTTIVELVDVDLVSTETAMAWCMMHGMRVHGTGTGTGTAHSAQH